MMRRTLVLLHAFPLSARMWDDVRPGLEEVVEVVTPDLPGFGGRPAPAGEPSLDVLADEVAAVLADRPPEEVVLGGLSMGGYVAMAFVRQHPGRIGGLVLADTKAGADAPAARTNRERVAATMLAERTPRVLLDDVLPGLLGATSRSSRPEVVERVRALIAASDPEGIAWAQRAMAARPDSMDTLRAVDVPTLVVVGDEDALSPPAEAQAMAAAVPHARLVVVPGSGHLSALEDPPAFVDAVTGFLADLPTR